MKEQSQFSKKAVAVWSLVLLVLTQQLASIPVPDLEDRTGSVQGSQRSLRRVVRMTPFWRNVGTKPHGAYCQNNYECSTGKCREGHCTFSQPMKS